MKLLTLMQPIAAVSLVFAGVIVPNESNVGSSMLCSGNPQTTLTLLSPSTHFETVTETQIATVTAQPNTVTIALQGPDAILSSLSSAFSVESQQLEINSQLAPNNPFTSGHPVTATSATRFTRTLVVPVAEATKTSAPPGQPPASDVYFIGESDGTTTWLTNFTPQESMTIGTTTVTLSPMPSVSASNTRRSRITEHATQTNTITMSVGRADPTLSATGGSYNGVGSQGWNSTSCNSSTAVASVYSSNAGSNNPESSFHTITVRRSSAVATTTIHLTTTPFSMPLPTDGYGATVNITFPTSIRADLKRSEGDGRRRAVCEWITATMRGTPVSWPNNWDGHKTVDCATFKSTTQPVPSPPPTMVTVTLTVPSASASTEASVSSSVPVTKTVVSVSSASTVVTPTATESCGVHGDFTLDFDTLPQFFPLNNDTAPFPPIFNPYRHLFFSSGWAYVPPPTTPVVPQNGSHLAVYVPVPETNSSVSQSRNAGDLPPRSFGAGPRAYDDAYWFDADTLYVFCDNGATDPAVTCDMAVTGYHWDHAAQAEVAMITQHFPQEPCPGFRNCRTNEIFLDAQFKGLSSISLYAAVNGEEKIFFIDTVQLTWWNNTCDAGLRRAHQL